MSLRVVVLGAGFGGLELTTILSEALGDRLDLTLIDKNDSFVFGFSKLDMMFGRTTSDAIRLPYRSIAKPGVRFHQETITAIDPETRRVTTNRGIYDADVLVLALGADFDVSATPGLAEGGDEFYSFAGAERLTRKLASFSKGRAIVGVTSSPFKCPPAPCETALMLHDFLTMRGVRGDCEITIVHPFNTPIPPSPETSRALLAAFAERGITLLAGRSVRALDPARSSALLDDGSELPYDLFLGVPKHRVPDVVSASGMTENGWGPVNPATLETRFPGVYAVGDVASIGIPKAGVFAEAAARVVAARVLAKFTGGDPPPPFAGAGICYIEFGGGRIGRVEVDFLSGQSTTATYSEASTALVDEKHLFGSIRRARWFGL